MRKLATAALIAALLSVAPAAHAHTRDRCRFGPDFTVGAVQRTITCAMHYYPVPYPNTVRCIANRESHFYAKAVNPSSGAAGVFQMIPSTWATWHARKPLWNRWWEVGADPLNGRNNVLTAIRVMHNTRSLDPWGGGCG